MASNPTTSLMTSHFLISIDEKEKEKCFKRFFFQLSEIGKLKIWTLGFIAVNLLICLLKCVKFSIHLVISKSMIYQIKKKIKFLSYRAFHMPHQSSRFLDFLDVWRYFKSNIYKIYIRGI